MFSRKIVGKILIPAAVLVSEKGKEMKCCKPSELPIYTSEPPPEPKRIMRDPPTKVEQEIGNVRRQIVSLSSQLTAIQDYAVDAVEEAWCECEGVIEYLQQEDNTTPRYGAIAVGGLAGFILGLRGGKFRKLLFTTIGALGMAAVCYPTEAAEYSEQIKEEAIQYFRIAYNFYHGVKKDDPPLELPSLPSLPSIPKNFSEFMNLFSSSSNKNSDSSVIGDKKESSVKETEAKTAG
nr:MICOS complex subunit MIC27 [Onthophagus taurus]